MYNLNEKVGQEYFEFTLDDFKYKMSYPTAKEIMQLSDVAANTEEWQDKISKKQKQLLTASEQDKTKLEAEIQDLNKKAKLSQTSFIDWCMEYIKPEQSDAPNVKDTLMAKNVKYLLAFMNMVQTELNDT